jgi:quinol-cytochrome oxidoreductase complex cytochrome b subunit
MSHSYIQNNTTLVAILVFLIIFSLIQYFRPAFLYNNDGSLREFGVGYRNKTIMPVWLLSIILGILSYVGVLYYLSYSRMY